MIISKKSCIQILFLMLFEVLCVALASVIFKWFSKSYVEEELDGQAVAAGLGGSNGCDWLKDVVPKIGLRLKVHKSLEDLFHKMQVSLVAMP